MTLGEILAVASVQVGFKECSEHNNIPLFNLTKRVGPLPISQAWKFLSPGACIIKFITAVIYGYLQ
jgi:hypothetical protein